MKQTKRLFCLFASLVLTIIFLTVPLFSALALEKVPDPIDPQSWKLQKDMTWDEWTPNPVVDWYKMYKNGYRGAANHYKAALVLIDFPDRPFDITLPKYSNPFGNPQIDPVKPDEVADYWLKFLNEPYEDNYYTSFNEFILENTFGDWSCELDVFGPYTLPLFEFQYGLNDGMNTSADRPPGFSTGSFATAAFTAIEQARELNYDDYAFVFFLHAGNDESGVWLEFGDMKWDKREDISYEFGPLAKLDQLQKLGYGNLISQQCWDWARDRNENGRNWASSRYGWTTWLSAASIWSSQSSSNRTNPFTGRSVRVLYSTQSEDCGMATFAHEFSHVVGVPDNYSSPYYYNREFSGPWDLLSWGCFNGPGGEHERWAVPGIMGGATPPHMMMNTKMWSSSVNFIKSGEYLNLNYNTLATMTPQVVRIASREVPVGEEWGVDALKGIRITNLADKVPISNAWDALRCQVPSPRPATMTIHGYTYAIDGGYSVSSGAFTGMTVEVVDRVGYDSFLNDHGVLISRTKASGSNNGNSWVIDANPGALDIIDYIKPGGEVVKNTYGSYFQLAKCAFHAGLGEGINNTWHDPYNFLKFYILDKQLTPNKYGDVLTYDIGVLRTDGVPAEGNLIVRLADTEAELPGRVAVVNYEITNIGNVTDIICVDTGGDLPGVLLNNFYAVGAGETITVSIYVEIPNDVFSLDWENLTSTITVSSESTIGKNGTGAAVGSEIILEKVDNVVPTAFVTKLNGNKNDLTITVTEYYNSGRVEVYTETFSIDNNAAGTYSVGSYTIYVDTKGNTQIREIYVVGD